MIAELWDSFPRLIEQNINALLDRAMPNPTKAFQIYKACQREDLWLQSYENFARRLEAFYAKPRMQRRKSDFDRFLERPMDKSTFEDFHLNFRTASVDSRDVHTLASWASNLMRVGTKTTSVVVSLDVVTRTLNSIIHPAAHEKAENIEFADFCDAWKKTVFNLFGRKHDSDLNSILRELHRLHQQVLESEHAAREGRVTPTIYLTQTEIDWTLAVREAALNYEPIPKFPLSRGAQKPRLIDLDRASMLYNLVLTTALPELLKHRDSIRATVLDRCDSLIREKAA